MPQDNFPGFTGLFQTSRRDPNGCARLFVVFALLYFLLFGGFAFALTSGYGIHVAVLFFLVVFAICKFERNNF